MFFLKKILNGWSDFDIFLIPKLLRNHMMYDHSHETLCSVHKLLSIEYYE